MQVHVPADLEEINRLDVLRLLACLLLLCVREKVHVFLGTSNPKISESLLKSILRPSHTTNGYKEEHTCFALSFRLASPTPSYPQETVKMFKKLFCLLAVFATASAFVAPASNGVGEFLPVLLKRMKGERQIGTG